MAVGWNEMARNVATAGNKRVGAQEEVAANSSCTLQFHFLVIHHTTSTATAQHNSMGRRRGGNSDREGHEVGGGFAGATRPSSLYRSGPALSPWPRVFSAHLPAPSPPPSSTTSTASTASTASHVSNHNASSRSGRGRGRGRGRGKAASAPPAAAAAAEQHSAHGIKYVVIPNRSPPNRADIWIEVHVCHNVESTRNRERLCERVCASRQSIDR
jgi:hypothetical protein